jgi:hypothetical protein
MGILEKLMWKLLGTSIDPEEFGEEELLGKMPEYLTLDESIDLLLVVEDEKPGALVMSASRDQRELIDAVCEKLDLHSREKPGLREPGVFVTKDPERFEILEDSKGDFYGSSDSAVGKFLGYEKDAREHYEELAESERIPAKEFNEKLAELEEKGEISPEKEKFLELVGYVPYPDEENIHDAIKEGKRRHEILESSEVGKSFLEQLEPDSED